MKKLADAKNYACPPPSSFGVYLCFLRWCFDTRRRDNAVTVLIAVCMHVSLVMSLVFFTKRIVLLMVLGLCFGADELEGSKGSPAKVVELFSLLERVKHAEALSEIPV